MFATVDQTLFPNKCVVLEIVPHTHYVLPIFKNGSSSLTSQGYRQVNLQELQDISVIDVFVRDPHDRFLSGVQTYLTKLPKLDPSTILYFVKHFLYLNRHFCPQVYWLLNACRYTNARFHIRPWEQLNTVTQFNENQSVPDPALQDLFAETRVKFFNEIDEALTVNLINQTVSMQDIISVIKNNYEDLYQETFGTAEEIVNVLHKT
jgi:hypothetical protein